MDNRNSFTLHFLSFDVLLSGWLTAGFNLSNIKWCWKQTQKTLQVNRISWANLPYWNAKDGEIS